MMFAIPDAWQNNLNQLIEQIQTTHGVEAVSVSEDGKTLFIKALQQGFDDEYVKQILTGV